MYLHILLLATVDHCNRVANDATTKGVGGVNRESASRISFMYNLEILRGKI